MGLLVVQVRCVRSVDQPMVGFKTQAPFVIFFSVKDQMRISKVLGVLRSRYSESEFRCFFHTPGTKIGCSHTMFLSSLLPVIRFSKGILKSIIKVRFLHRIAKLLVLQSFDKYISLLPQGFNLSILRGLWLFLYNFKFILFW